MPLEDALTLTAVKTHTDGDAAFSTVILTAVETHRHTAPLASVRVPMAVDRHRDSDTLALWRTPTPTHTDTVGNTDNDDGSTDPDSCQHTHRKRHCLLP